MQTNAVASGFGKYLSTLVATILFPLQWMRMLKLAQRHETMDPMGPKKVMAGAIAGLLLAGFGAYLVYDFQSGAVDGAYQTLDMDLSNALGNEQYLAHVAAADAAQGRVELAERKLADGEDPELWNANKAQAEQERDEETANANALRANHELYGAVQEFVMAQNDAGAKETIAERGAIDFPNLDERSDRAFASKDRAVSDMQFFMTWLVWPGVIGVLFAPIIFATSTVLRNAFIPSDGVGYKQYPGGAMALFLLFGGFGVPALFFAAWTFQDMESRSLTGQITL